jgi:hypothetical protein
MIHKLNFKKNILPLPSSGVKVVEHSDMKFYFVDSILKGLQFQENNTQKILWFVWPINIQDLMVHSQILSKIPTNLKVNLTPL